MHKVIYWDRSFVIIRDEQVESVAIAKARGKSFWLHHQGGRDFIDPKAIARITRAKASEYQVEVPKNRQLAQGERSEEERQRALAKVEEIKRTAPWYNKRHNKKEEA